jgi:hypothetical protein
MSNFSQTIFNWLGLARYNAVLPSAANGEAVELQATNRGVLRVNVENASAVAYGNAGTWVFNPNTGGTLIASGLLVTGAANLGGIDLYIGTGSTTVMLFDATSLPANGTAPKLRMFAATGPANLTKCFRDTGNGIDFSTGIFVACSSTNGTLTYDNTKAIAVAACYR